MNKRTGTDCKIEDLRVGPTLVVASQNGGVSSDKGRNEQHEQSRGRQNNRPAAQSRNASKTRPAIATLDLERRLPYVKCAFAAGAVIAFACMLYSSILSKEGKFHFVAENGIRSAAAAFPDSDFVRQLQILYLSGAPYDSPCYQGSRGYQGEEERTIAMWGELSDRIKRDPENLELRIRRVALCQFFQVPQENGGEYLHSGQSDMELIVSRRGNADDWAGLALMQGLNNDPKWQTSIKQAKKLGYKFGRIGSGSSNLVLATLRDGSYLQPDIIPWLRAVAELTGDHSADTYIATLYFQCGKYEEAAKEYDNLIKNGVEQESNAMFHLLRGACLKWTGHPELAREAFRNCLSSPEGFDSAYKAMARGALGDRSLEQSLNGQPESGRVLYYVLSDQYRKATKVTATPVSVVQGLNGFGPAPCEPEPFGNAVNDAEVTAGADSFDQFEMATGIKPEPQLPRKKDILEGPADTGMITECTANIHFLKEMAYKKTNNEKLAAAEHREAIKFIPPNLRRELQVK
ncbi:MAG: tetratricopeptide repeat protein [Candidatus Obscuribacterales bacterium]|nr:tetratricopeptide repeat protein [Candidatus Obscuribacterales bacterium]